MLFKRIVILTVLLFQVSIVAYGQNIRFNGISLAEGLSQSTVTCFMQDQQGYIWVGTDDGLNRYNGYQFTVLNHSDHDSTSLSSNRISAILQDSKQRIWVGTDHGLNLLDSKSLKSKSLLRSLSDSASINSNRIRCIAEDHSGNIWIGSERGLNLLPADSSWFTSFQIESGNSASLSNNMVNDIHVDNQGRVWVATDGGLNLFDSYTGEFVRFRNNEYDQNTLDNNKVTVLEAGPSDTLWLGTRSGLNYLNLADTENWEIERAVVQEGKLNSASILDLCNDSSGELWIGTAMCLGRVNASRLDGWSEYRTSPNDFYTLPNDHITSIIEDQSGMIWIGTKSAGIATYNKELPIFESVNFAATPGFLPSQNQIFEMCDFGQNELWMATGRGIAVFDLETGNSHFLSDIAHHPLVEVVVPIASIATLGDTMVWLGTRTDGLISYDLRTKVVTRVGIDTDPNIPSNNLTKILPDVDGNLWLGTSGKGVVFFDTHTFESIAYGFDIDDPNSLRDNNVHALEFGNDTTLWVGTGNDGVYKFNTKSRKFVPFDYSNQGLPAVGVNDLFADKSGRLWVGFAGGGFALIDEEAELLEMFTTENGLASNEVLSVLSDKYGNLWLTTNRGISLFNIASKEFRNYSEKDVLGRNTFYPKSSYRDSKGILYFGGANGFGYFDASGLQANTFIPPILVTGLLHFNESTVDDQEIMPQVYLDSVLLKHDHTGFSLEFAALNFKQPEKNQFAYRLLGMFDQWRYIGNRRYATFLNLDPGRYVFEVKGSNNDGAWNEEPARVVVLVKPAFWQTIWFQSLVAIAFISMLYLFYRYKLSSQQQRNKELEIAVGTRTKEIAQERDTNAILLREVHHRVKNNLQVIVSLLNLQMRFIENKQLINIFSEVQNRVRSMSMIHQKMYQTKDLQSVDIEEYITDLSNNLLATYQLAHEISLEIDVVENHFKSDTLTPLGLIINEIISNALKYAFEEGMKGKIFVKLTKLSVKRRYRLIIGDNGVGIDPEELENPSESFGTELIDALVEQLNGNIQLLQELPGTMYQIDFEDV